MSTQARLRDGGGPGGTAGLMIALFALNWVVVGRLSTIEYLSFMGSIEGTHIALGRWVLEHWPDLGWYPLWYAGLPFVNTYPPLLPHLVAAVSHLADWTPAHAYHAVTAVAYCLGPVTLFLLAYRLSGKRSPAFAAAVLYSLLSPAALLIPAYRADLGGALLARRLLNLVAYGEGPLIAALTLLPIAVLLVHLVLDERRILLVPAAALAIAAVAVTNWVGSAALVLVLFAYLASTVGVRAWRPWVEALLLGAFAYCLVAPWLPPSAIRDFTRNVSARERTPPFDLLQLSIAAGLLLIVFLAARWLQHRGFPGHLRFFLVLLLVTGTVTLASTLGEGNLISVVTRFHLEMDMAFCLVAVFACVPLWRRLSRSSRAILLVPLAALALAQLSNHRTFAHRQMVPIEIEATVEHQTAVWVGANLPGARVMLPGSIGFWLNVFGDTAQLEGGALQGNHHPFLHHLRYQIYTGQGAGEAATEVAVLWLKAFGVKAIGWGGPDSREFFRPYEDPDKFVGVLRELRRDGDDVIYEVAQRSESLAHALEWEDFAPRHPGHILDVETLRPYVAALEDPELPEVEIHWLDPSRAIVTGELDPEHWISVQMTHHAGWRATVDDRPVKVHQDNLGLIALEPRCSGRCRVELSFDGGWEAKTLRIMSRGAWAVAVAWLLVGWLGWHRARASGVSGDGWPSDSWDRS